jgi:hypothetical protein
VDDQAMQAMQAMQARQAVDCETLLLDVHRLTEEMRFLAESGDWDEVKVREESRRMLLSELFASPVPSPLVSNVRTCLAKALSANAAIIAICHAGRQSIGEQLEVLGQGRKAKRAYSAQCGLSGVSADIRPE